jgi:hypothetical protein
MPRAFALLALALAMTGLNILLRDIQPPRGDRKYPSFGMAAMVSQLVVPANAGTHTRAVTFSPVAEAFFQLRGQGSQSAVTTMATRNRR